ncbi:hypothetical protein GOODEAATRI_009137 [Goodea atripinnis]|uniref:Secreted protein n=1 Tax=Goodea atripinnis TaxID=208336 RepID=A0ABV0PCL6_9TELE
MSSSLLLMSPMVVVLLFCEVVPNASSNWWCGYKGMLLNSSSHHYFLLITLKIDLKKKTGERQPSVKLEQTIFISAANCVISPFQTEPIQAYQVARQKPEPSLRHTGCVGN